ncbi:MAG TPA: hypothetical protein PKE26_05265 [Kiritimatiellia bacterium]|nr:hypothetical protein [Kiritimatiellia bacterium]
MKILWLLSILIPVIWIVEPGVPDLSALVAMAWILAGGLVITSLIWGTCLVARARIQQSVNRGDHS